jgi:predicted transposase/invertase (TIGR01784 family)
VTNFGEDERQAYEEHLKWIIIEVNTLRKYEAKGLAEDIEEGERKKAIAISKNMLSKDMNLENVSSLTGLSVEEISQL